KYGMGLNHMPSGRFGANAAWLGLNAIAHNLVRWVARIGLEESLVMTKTMRRRYFCVPGRITTSARKDSLHVLVRADR
ncbi:MAG: IS1380 family transposase, partial [Actinobacteria bacterium]|nr:IS1380 family transposase [Actinomycetota bacterium]